MVGPLVQDGRRGRQRREVKRVRQDLCPEENVKDPVWFTRDGVLKTRTSVTETDDKEVEE